MALPTTPIVNELRPDRLRAIIYGQPGAGKTTLAAGWYPKTNLLIDVEGGTRFLTGEHYVVRPKSFAEFIGVVNDLVKGGHQYTTVTIDTIDTLIRMADAEAGQRGGKVAAGLVEYGKGMADRDGVVLRELGKLLASDLGVILTAHPTTVEVKQEDGSELERIYPRIDQQDRLRQPIMGMVDFIVMVRRAPDEARSIITGGSVAAETKRRVDLPDVLPADAAALYSAVAAGCQAVAA